MATAEQIKALIRSHISHDEEHFYTLALQVAAHEAHQGHGALAHDIRDIIDRSRNARHKSSLGDFPKELENLVSIDLPGVHLASLVLPEHIIDRIERGVVWSFDRGINCDSTVFSTDAKFYLLDLRALEKR